MKTLSLLLCLGLVLSVSSAFAVKPKAGLVPISASALASEGFRQVDLEAVERMRTDGWLPSSPRGQREQRFFIQLCWKLDQMGRGMELWACPKREKVAFVAASGQVFSMPYAGRKLPLLPR
jgi:hypothetical protein